MEIAAFILGLGASAFVIALSVLKGQKIIALVSVLMSAVLIGQYLLLDQPVATVLAALTLLYGLLILATVGRTDSFSKAANSSFVRLGLLAAYTVVFALLNGGFHWDIQLLAYFGNVLMVAVMMVSQPWMAKLILLGAGICWTIFQFQTGAYGNLVGQLFYFSGLIWSSWKLWSQRSAIGSELSPEPKLQRA